MVLKYIIEKEFRQMRRNPIIPRLILAFPCMMMILMPWAANLEIKYNNLAVVDLDHSMSSRRLVEKVASTDYFNLVENAPDYGHALESVEKGEADIILEIPEHFEKDLATGQPVRVQVSANAVNGTKGGLGSSYLTAVVNDFVLRGQSGQVRMSVLNLYNPHLDYKKFMVPALLIILLTLICGFLPALNIVGEKETGTIEQLNVTPLGKSVFILGKLVPYWLVGLVVLTIGMALAALLYGIVPVGSFGLIYFFACVFILTISGFGLIISNYSIRTDAVLNSVGNFPLWHADLFRSDSRMQAAFSRHSHILDFDSLRLGRRIVEQNKYADSFEFGVLNITEIGKERGNNLELQEKKKSAAETNQKNDLFNYTLKMIRHSATVDNFPFVKVIVDEQRPESWGADARDLCEIVHIDECSDMRLSMPLFGLGDWLISKLVCWFQKSYYEYRYDRGDNTLPMYLCHGAVALLDKYRSGIYNRFGYMQLNVSVEDGTQSGERKAKKYYLMSKKIYSKRFSTDAFSDYFNQKALTSPVGIDDLREFASEKATWAELTSENSYFFNDLTKIKQKHIEKGDDK